VAWRVREVVVIAIATGGFAALGLQRNDRLAAMPRGD